MNKESIIIKKDISRKVYEENGINVYEKIFRPNATPFWGITPKVIEMLKKKKSHLLLNSFGKDTVELFCHKKKWILC